MIGHSLDVYHWPAGGATGVCLGRKSDGEKATEMFDDLISEPSKRYVPSSVKAALYSVFGEKDTAFEWLVRACDEKGILPDILKYGPWIDDFRSDLRFKALLKKINLE